MNFFFFLILFLFFFFFSPSTTILLPIQLEHIDLGKYFDILNESPSNLSELIKLEQSKGTSLGDCKEIMKVAFH
ncbi:hypothetical protein SLEP1_g1223 [Rubroshorea leprosula]|uniref:Uncharacterized protein n=1 Tax=Rubroshorea leprosula TaxID=152421 RepID=A0AAV5HLG4_9ROSI|nr:hypothetical protein SLEP1_g1223 [Rubroshorea leprosula]